MRALGFDNEMKVFSPPRLADLPPPSLGKTGWPWTEESPSLPQRMPDGSEWPRISIVTPNYNYARYLETTIRSVLLQGYPNVEYIIQDDGSTDASADLIRRYEQHLAYWSTETNSGQSAVINRGMRRSTGSILAYINSDDYYLPGAFEAVALFFHQHPEADLVYGRCWFVDENEQKIGDHLGRLSRLDEVLDLWEVWWRKRQIVQPESFWRRRIYEKVGDFRTDLHIVFDYEYWCRMFMAGAVFRGMNKAVACFRFQPAQKTSDSSRTADEELAVIKPLLWDKGVPLTAKRRRELQAQWLYHKALRPVLESSLQRNESKFRRWARVIAVCIRHPQIPSAPMFRQRLRSVFGVSS
jgi:glycosyltransferase involved in cell wall biosynthesis